jgi:hypothetical protein
MIIASKVFLSLTNDDFPISSKKRAPHVKNGGAMPARSAPATDLPGNPASKSAAESKSGKNKAVKFFKGSTDVLVIAPHGVKTKPMDDNRTDIVACRIAKQLGCSALINDRIKRSERNYNDRNHAEKDHAFIMDLRSVLASKGHTLVLWIHGYKWQGQTGLKKQLGLGRDQKLDCLIGYGQGKQERHTAREHTVKRLIGVLADQGIVAHKAPVELPGKKYCGHALNNMNQWCRLQPEYTDKSQVESIQLEFKEPGFRETDALAAALGVKIANAINELIRSNEAEKIG